MIGLIGATIFVAMREKKAQAKAIKDLAPQPLGDIPDSGDDAMVQEGFGDEADGFGDPVDSFDSAES